MEKITISEFEKELQKIDGNVEVVEAGKYSECDYDIKFDIPDYYLCGFNLGRLNGLKVWAGNHYDRGASDRVLNKAIELIPHLVPDDYKEPTREEAFKEFKKSVKDRGFYIPKPFKDAYYLRFKDKIFDYTIAVFDKNHNNFKVIGMGDAPADKYLEGLKLFLDYVDKVRVLKPVKLYKIPLPGLITTDWEQQYLSEKDGSYFASRKNKSLKQTWTEEELEEVPDEYRGCAMEVEDENKRN